MMRRVIATGLAVGVGVLIAWFASESGEEDLWKDLAPGSGESSSEGLFAFSDPYLDGRSMWLRARFEADIEAFDADATRELPSIEARAHDGPFTEGPWVNALDGLARKRRQTAEKRAIESTVEFRVPDAEPRRVALMLATGGVIKWTGEPGEYSHKVCLTTPDPRPRDLRAVPQLDMGAFLVRQSWKGGTMARPTATWLLHRLERREELIVLRWQLWTNAGSDRHVPVRLDAGQLLFAPHTSGGTAVSLHTYYRGQTFPSMLKALALKRTRQHYERWCKEINSHASTWRTDSRTGAWAANLGL